MVEEDDGAYQKFMALLWRCSGCGMGLGQPKTSLEQLPKPVADAYKLGRVTTRGTKSNRQAQLEPLSDVPGGLRAAVGLGAVGLCRSSANSPSLATKTNQTRPDQNNCFHICILCHTPRLNIVPLLHFIAPSHIYHSTTPPCPAGCSVAAMYSFLSSISDRMAKDTSQRPAYPATKSTVYISSDDQLPCVPPLKPDLHDLNDCLAVLAEAFPDVQVEVFREMLDSFSGESRLALVANVLLKDRALWVKGRWRQPPKEDETLVVLPTSETYRSEEYKKAAVMLAAREFKGLSVTAIKSALADVNYNYLAGRQTLDELQHQTWRFSISMLFAKRKPWEIGDLARHPLVVWRPGPDGDDIPTIRSTGNAELDRELYDALIAPQKKAAQERQRDRDREVAITINQQEAEKYNSTYECGCCYCPVAFEEVTYCHLNEHIICFRCVQHVLKEAIFGQAWLNSINPNKGTLKCVSVEGHGKCQGHISSDDLHRAMMADKRGAEALHQLEVRLAHHHLREAKVPLIHCPFCDYAEVNEIYSAPGDYQMTFKSSGFGNIGVIILCVITLVCHLPILITMFFLSTFGTILARHWDNIPQYWQQAIARRYRSKRSNRFECRNPECGRPSCLACHKVWRDIHICNESGLLALRTQVEQAMSMAIKRICPNCNTAFIKNSGCNKLTCPCGFKMCYVCRENITENGYRHYCDHFRPTGDGRPCRTCKKCNLWENEDEEAVLAKAKETAEKQWRDQEVATLSKEGKQYELTGFEPEVKLYRSPWEMFKVWNYPKRRDVYDFVLNTFFD